MNDKRKLEIATRIVEAITKEHLRFNSNIEVELRDLAEKLDIPAEEMAEFLAPIIDGLAEKMIGAVEKIQEEGNFSHH